MPLVFSPHPQAAGVKEKEDGDAMDGCARAALLLVGVWPAGGGFRARRAGESRQHQTTTEEVSFLRRTLSPGESNLPALGYPKAGLSGAKSTDFENVNSRMLYR
jgi:hypothetical protein